MSVVERLERELSGRREVAPMWGTNEIFKGFTLGLERALEIAREEEEPAPIYVGDGTYRDPEPPEKTCACGEWPVEEYGERCPSCAVDGVPADVQIARPHSYAEGDVVRHVDSIDAPENECLVEARTWRIVGDVAHPTYSLVSVSDPSDRVDDVLCTLDLVAVDGIKNNRLQGFHH